jgi:hypothetical protein
MTSVAGRELSFFLGVAGSVVYGHGIPKNVTPLMRTAIATLTDTLFLLISIRLLQGISCDYSDPAVRRGDRLGHECRPSDQNRTGPVKGEPGGDVAGRSLSS